MPEGTDTLSAPFRELRFVAVAPTHLAPGDTCIDARSGLSGIQRGQGEAWRSLFVDWLGTLNKKNASLPWWGYTSTAKNMLSSPLGDDCFAVLALDRFLAATDAKRVFVVGARPAQRMAMREHLRNSHWRVEGGAGRTPFFRPLLRSLWQLARMLMLWCARRLRPPAGNGPQAVLFTYVDREFRGAQDAFFGSLAERLAGRTPPVHCCHVAFLHSDYAETLPKLGEGTSGRYEPLFGSLRLADLLLGGGLALLAWWRAGRYKAPELAEIPSTPLLRAALRWDIGQGGYLYNVLVYLAARRLLSRWRPAWLIYPYENKALEKMLVLAARESSPQCRIVGYQHTAITRRHATLLFAEGEAERTPLPDRIVSVGDVTRRYLQGHGRYPTDIFVTGCALRQQRGPLLERRAAGASKSRLLLALSSSRRELIEAVDLCRSACEGDDSLELAIRAHPEFPLALLPPDLRVWVDRHATDLSGTPLASNLEWCDAVAYVSSTVALEALGRGRPVINVRISDPIDPDPVLDPVPFHWPAATPESLATAVREIAMLGGIDFERRRLAALSYVDEYLKQPSDDALEAFLA